MFSRGACELLRFLSLRSLATAMLAGVSVVGWAQPADEEGRPLLRNFAASEYDAHVWNSSAVQDGRGVLYVGNNDGLLEYDGARWRLIVLPGRSHVGSLGRDAEGRVWVGAIGTMGYLAPDSLGRTAFVPVTGHLPPEAREFTFVRRTIPTSGGIWFEARPAAFRFVPDAADPGRGSFDFLMDIHEAGELFAVGDDLVSWRPGRGLARLEGALFEQLPHGSRFADEAVRFILPYDPGRLLVGTSSSGLFLVSDSGVTPFAGPEAFGMARISSGVDLGGVGFAVGTSSSGVFVLGREGRVRHHVDMSVGLQDNVVRSLYVDYSGSLWAMLEDGISRIDVNSPITIFDRTSGLDGVALRVRRHEGRIYAGTVADLRVLDPTEGRFRPVPGVMGRTDGLLSTGDQLLAATPSGVFAVHRSGVTPARPPRDENDSANMIVGTTADPDVAFVGCGGGVAVLSYRNGVWTDLGTIDGISKPVHSGSSLPDGTVWVTDEPGRAYRIRPLSVPITSLSDLAVEAFGPAQGLPELGSSSYGLDGKPWFTSFGGVVYGLNESKGRMEPTRIFDDLLTGYPLDWLGFHGDARGRVWVPVGNRGMTMARLGDDGNYHVEPSALRRLGSALIIDVLPEADGVVWMAGSGGMIRYEADRPIQQVQGHPVLIRGVVSGEDSLLYHGMGPAPETELAYARGRLRIEYALPVMKGPGEYRTRLDGFDEDWSRWTGETARVYTNLPDGDYRFRVQARDTDGIDGGEAAFEFVVLPPWHRTAWAYLLFAGLGVGVLWLLRRYEMGRLRLKHHLDLQHIESRRLKDVDRVRTDFFANISHEFRTPLTLILGPVDDALEGGKELGRARLTAIRDNGRRLLRLINQILDLSKLEAGGMELNASRQDLIPFLSGLLYSFESMADRKGITLSLTTSGSRMPVLFEQDRLEQVFLNLFSNAIRFTPEGGSISVACRRDGAQAVITVADTGCGIPGERLSRIFDRYFQSGLARSSEKEGTGIGLALSRALVDLHGGTISVESEVGRGTTFTVRLPSSDGEVEEGEAVRLAEQPSGEHEVPADDPEVPGDDRPLVLVVEDHADVRAYLRECLSDEYRIRQAADGEDGLEQARDLIPDLIIADVAMPRMDGYDLARSLRSDERTSHVPIIMLTARASDADKVAGLETGVDDYQLKPFNPRELRLRVRNLIAQREEARRRFSTATVIRASEVAAASIDQAFLERVFAAIETHMSDESVGVDRLADEVGMSVSQLNRKLNALIDQPAGSLLRSMRLQRAADLLVQQAGTVGEIAYEVGYSNQAHFSTAFRKQFGVTPSGYRERGGE